jgi:hypothetical protein
MCVCLKLHLFFVCPAFFALFDPSRLFQLLAKDPLDLPVHAAEFISRPLLQCFVGVVIDPYDKTFLGTHAIMV